MSWQSAEEPEATAAPGCKAIETVIVPHPRDIGGFEVRRVLPSLERRSVGPFVFFDQMGPAELMPGSGIDVRPHPHIGLATVTYLFAGTIVHRDSLGSVQSIEPGAVNWMTAGRGIVHSERSDAELRKRRQSLYGIQIWVALPKPHEETAPDFTHYPAASLPVTEGGGRTVRVIAGSLYGKTSPVKTFSSLFYADATLQPSATLSIANEYLERALYLLEGDVELAGQRFSPGRLLVFSSGDEITVKASSTARLLLFGGEPLDGPRHVWWNFVSSSRERIEQAKSDWKAGRFAPVPGDSEFIPLPENS
ncbi:MAG: pirin family protein [Deltaproteobacteria bacterium]|nr:MAG: pirin family protein [Deltaproteobacteria bacterium]